MSIYLGNLTIEQFKERTGYLLTEKDSFWLNDHLQQIADIKYGSEKFHIFDLPFSIHCDETIINDLMSILRKYENQKPALEQLSILPIIETEAEKARRLEKEQDEERKANPNSVWNIKWHMCVLVNNQYYYTCFINTYTKGYENIPKIINGTAWIQKDLRGFDGRFELKNPEIDSDANKYPEWNYVIGSGFRNLKGDWLGEVKNPFFEKIAFDIAEAIKTFEQLTGRKSTEIYYNK